MQGGELEETRRLSVNLLALTEVRTRFTYGEKEIWKQS